MRKLQTSDLFAAMRIVKKANIKEELKPILKLAAEGRISINDIGIEGILSFIEIMSEKKSEQAIYEVLSGPFEMDAKDIEKMDIMALADNIKVLTEENDLKAFFKLLFGLMSKS